MRDKNTHQRWVLGMRRMRRTQTRLAQLATCLSTGPAPHDLATVACVNPSPPRTSPHRPQKICTIVPRVGRNVIAKMVSVNP